MKRKLLIILAILAIALLAIPNFVGGGIQSATVDALLDRVPAETRAVLDIQQTEFQRGWFSSRARVEVRLDELDALAGEAVALILDMDIRHGPLLFTPQGIRLGTAYAHINPSVNGLRMENLAPDAAVETVGSLLYLYAGFGSTLQLGVDVDQLTASSPEFRFSVTDIRGTSLILPDLSSTAEAEITSTTLTAANGQFDLAIQNLLASGSRSDISLPVSTGESTISIAQLRSSAPLPFTLNSLLADYRLNDSPDRAAAVDFAQNFSVESIDWDMPVSSLDWQLQVKQLSRLLLNSYAQLAQQASQPPAGTPTQTGSLLNGISQEFALLLARENFQLDNELQLGAFEGNHRLTLDINWLGLPDLASIEAFQPGAALNAVEIYLTFDGDQAALMNSPFAQTVIDYQAMLEVDGGRVKAFVSLANGELNINGDILPLEQFVNL